jgi:hypothetical protein
MRSACVWRNILNTPINDGNEKENNVIPVGQTTKHYNAMLLQALAQTKEQATKTQKDIAAARERLKRRDNAFRSWFVEQKPVQEISPASSYQQHLVEVEHAPTIVLPPLPHQTDELDISLEPTRIQENWNPQELLAELQQKQRPPITERHARITKRLSVPLPGPLDTPPTHHNYYESDCALTTLVETGVSLYIRDYGCIPKRIELSSTAHSLLPIISDWEEGYPYRDGFIPIVSNSHLIVNAVRCRNN